MNTALLVKSMVASTLLAGPGDSSTVASAIAEYLRRAEAFGFSGSVLVEVKGRPIVHAGFGLANRATGERITPSTPFALASVSKQFVSSAVMLLAQQGKLAPNDSLGRFFPDLPPDKRGITLHELLTHTSGISDRRAPTARDAESFVRAVLARPLASKPGEAHRYSNLGYGVLAALIERVSGQPYAEFMDHALFAPLGMRGTYVVGAPGKSRRTHAYRASIDFGEPAPRDVMWNDVSGVGIVSTTEDLLRWERALRRRALISEASQRAMFTPYAESFGYGWTVQTNARGTTTISHNGLKLPEGWNSDYRRFPDDSVVVIVLSNTYREDALGWLVATNIVRLVFGGEVTFPPSVAAVPASVRLALSGEYAIDSTSGFRLARQGESLTLEPVGQAAVNTLLFGAARDTLGFADANARATRVIEAVRDDALQRVATELADVQPVAEWRTEMRATWDSLVARYGDYRRHEVLYSSPSPVNPSASDTYLRLHFARDSVVIRYSWNDGKLWGASDMGSFPGRQTEVERIPSALPVAMSPDGQLVVMSLVSGSTRRLRIVRQDGRVARLEVVGVGPPILAIRCADPHCGS
ncbi:MAG TPA: serine hydrolase domain-containing protein [Gemmatimonadaceae bacterium]|nr:serine hydrolase domain-containing protein [Gemmatimonadaceae bacterium]